MAKHVWSVLCQKASQDKDTNVVSLLQVVEKLTAQGPGSIHDEIAEGRSFMQADLELATWWVRSDYEKPETPQCRVSILGPDGAETGRREYEIRLQRSKSYRVIMKVPGIPLDRGSGIFWFVVQQQEDGEWAVKARVPLEVEIDLARGKA